jgi:hypothetical protein
MLTSCYDDDDGDYGDYGDCDGEDDERQRAAARL